MKFLPIPLTVKENAPVELQPVGKIAETEIPVHVQLIPRVADQSLWRRPVRVQLRHRLLDAGAHFAITGPLAVIIHAQRGRIGRAQDFPPDQIQRHRNIAALVPVFHAPEQHIHGYPENRNRQKCEPRNHAVKV